MSLVFSLESWTKTDEHIDLYFLKIILINLRINLMYRNIFVTLHIQTWSNIDQFLLSTECISEELVLNAKLATASFCICMISQVRKSSIQMACSCHLVVHLTSAFFLFLCILFSSFDQMVKPIGLPECAFPHVAALGVEGSGEVRQSILSLSHFQFLFLWKHFHNFHHARLMR